MLVVIDSDLNPLQRPEVTSMLLLPVSPKTAPANAALAPSLKRHGFLIPLGPCRAVFHEAASLEEKEASGESRSVTCWVERGLRRRDGGETGSTED